MNSYEAVLLSDVLLCVVMCHPLVMYYLFDILFQIWTHTDGCKYWWPIAKLSDIDIVGNTQLFGHVFGIRTHSDCCENWWPMKNLLDSWTGLSGKC